MLFQEGRGGTWKGGAQIKARWKEEKSYKTLSPTGRDAALGKGRADSIRAVSIVLLALLYALFEAAASLGRLWAHF